VALDNAQNVRDANEALRLLNARLPEGVRVTYFGAKPDRYTKSLASYVYAASYEICCAGLSDAAARMTAFFAEDSITISKTSHKTGKTSQTDIRNRMLGFTVLDHAADAEDAAGDMHIGVTLRADAVGMLNPGAFFEAFCAHGDIDFATLTPIITRTAILGADGKPLI
jgi:hypothetical protein